MALALIAFVALVGVRGHARGRAWPAAAPGLCRRGRARRMANSSTSSRTSGRSRPSRRARANTERLARRVRRRGHRAAAAAGYISEARACCTTCAVADGRRHARLGGALVARAATHARASRGDQRTDLPHPARLARSRARAGRTSQQFGVIARDAARDRASARGGAIRADAAPARAGRRVTSASTACVIAIRTAACVRWIRICAFRPASASASSARRARASRRC